MNNIITIAGRTLTFQVLQIPGELISDKMTNRTDFYEGTYTNTYKKWGLFGETITLFWKDNISKGNRWED